MQQTKITKTLGEFQKFFDSDNKTGLCLEDTLRFSHITRNHEAVQTDALW